MSKYEELIKKARKNFLKLTIDQKQEIFHIYTAAIDELSSEAKKSKDGTLTQRWLIDYTKALKKARDNMQKELSSNINEYIGKAAEEAIVPDTELFKDISKFVDLGPHFTEMFSRVPEDVLSVMIKGRLYKDHKSLSKRIWKLTNEFGQNIDYVIKRAMAEKKTAYELAKDLEEFVKPESRRSWNWGKVYPNMRNVQIDYNAQRLARTAITHGFREAQYQAAKKNPFVKAIHWELSPQHYERQVKKWGEDICDEYARHDEGLGKGNFKIDEVPIGHPGCLCPTWPVIVKSIDDIVAELKEWVRNPEGNKKLNDWYENVYKKEIARR
ncbi:hypothetical protein Q2T46_11690 [Thermoanaerobacterium sp. CMT5567-10]|uniref:hypothetical protein n=1 Tax=Thermoanaerobacterium sp. CMT5567-10 TaxID=3061989 RepID=UPI0026DECA6E|nr:hypothetical protein [Thermoanaerobacterium sp. CMT5567-10]WKV08189.1 hypothetical protein Q2T46_11690 [Thermoanaerobacterium sp. CMT5567-10]